MQPSISHVAATKQDFESSQMIQNCGVNLESLPSMSVAHSIYCKDASSYILGSSGSDKNILIKLCCGFILAVDLSFVPSFFQN